MIGGEVGLNWLLWLGAVTVLAAIGALLLQRAPHSWRRAWLPDLFFAVGLVVQLAILGVRSLGSVEIDVDSMRHATALLDAQSLHDAIRVRGEMWAADYLLQGPLVHLLRSVLPLGPLGAYRLLTIGAAAATALLLRSGARRLGAGPWASCLAGLLPLNAFGPAWLVATLDDNVAAAAFEWAFVFAFFGAVAVPCERGRRLRAMCIAGVLLGLSVSFHRKGVLWAVMVPVAPLIVRDLRNVRSLAGLVALGVIAAAIHLLAAALFLPGGLGAAGIAQLVHSSHHQNPTWWLLAGSGDLAAQSAAVWDGMRSTLIVFPFVSEIFMEPSHFRVVDGIVPIALGVALVAVWKTRAAPACRLLAVGIAAQCAHSLLYEPRSIERWDSVLAGAGVLVAVSLATRGAPPRGAGDGAAASAVRGAPGVLGLGAVWLWLMLASLQHLGAGLHADATDLARRLRLDVSVPGAAPEANGETVDGSADAAASQPAAGRVAPSRRHATSESAK